MKKIILFIALSAVSVALAKPNTNAVVVSATVVSEASATQTELQEYAERLGAMYKVIEKHNIKVDSPAYGALFMASKERILTGDDEEYAKLIAKAEHQLKAKGLIDPAAPEIKKIPKKSQTRKLKNETAIAQAEAKAARLKRLKKTPKKENNPLNT